MVAGAVRLISCYSYIYRYTGISLYIGSEDALILLLFFFSDFILLILRGKINKVQVFEPLEFKTHSIVYLILLPLQIYFRQFWPRKKKIVGSPLTILCLTYYKFSFRFSDTNEDKQKQSIFFFYHSAAE